MKTITQKPIDLVAQQLHHDTADEIQAFAESKGKRATFKISGGKPKLTIMMMMVEADIGDWIIYEDGYFWCCSDKKFQRRYRIIGDLPEEPVGEEEEKAEA